MVYSQAFKDKLSEIGEDMASGWGGECICWQINWKDLKVLFDCIEHGERFYTEATFAEIKEWYKFDIIKAVMK